MKAFPRSPAHLTFANTLHTPLRFYQKSWIGAEVPQPPHAKGMSDSSFLHFPPFDPCRNSTRNWDTAAGSLMEHMSKEGGDASEALALHTTLLRGFAPRPTPEQVFLLPRKGK